ncbi:MAG: hypothetical protein AABY14_04785, partial [Nanoarchaeota archaeon]
GLNSNGGIVKGDYEAELRIKTKSREGDGNSAVYQCRLEVIKTENDQVILGNSMNLAALYSKGHYSQLTTGLRNKLGLKETN